MATSVPFDREIVPVLVKLLELMLTAPFLGTSIRPLFVKLLTEMARLISPDKVPLLMIENPLAYWDITVLPWMIALGPTVKVIGVAKVLSPRMTELKTAKPFTSYVSTLTFTLSMVSLGPSKVRVPPVTVRDCEAMLMPLEMLSDSRTRFTLPPTTSRLLNRP